MNRGKQGGGKLGSSHYPSEAGPGYPLPKAERLPEHEPLCPEKAISGFSPETCHQKTF